MNMNVLIEYVLSVIYRYVCRIYLRECCGFVFVDVKVKEGMNIQDELYMVDFWRYLCMVVNGYMFFVMDIVFFNSSFKMCSLVFVIYYFYLDVGVYFSWEDIDKVLYVGELMLLVDYLVVDVVVGNVCGVKLFVWCNGCFECI